MTRHPGTTAAVTDSPPTPQEVTTAPPPLAVAGLRKSYRSVHAVRDLTFTVRRGRVTALLGPNGAGKTTALRILLGLTSADAGSALVQGQRYADLTDPARTIGAVIESGPASSGAHPGRRAFDHLRILCSLGGLPASRVQDVLVLVGLEHAARRRVGGFSLGMRQRLAIAAALLGDPEVLVLDEPANGLDPDGARWLRTTLRQLADEGRTVLVSSHALAEVQQSVDDVVVIADGRLVHQSSLRDLGIVTQQRTPALEERYLDLLAEARREPTGDDR